jgi:hypothetical protein
VKRVALLSMLLVLLGACSAAAAIPCKHTGKSWRLVEGRKCWTDRWMPKDQLYWPGTKGKEFAEPARPVKTALAGATEGSEGARPVAIARAVGASPTSPPPEPAIEPPSAEMLKALQERAAEMLKALQERAEPQLVRTAPANPYEFLKPDLPPDIEPLVPPDIVPLPRPRSRKLVPALGQPETLAWFPLLLAGMMLGNAAARRAATSTSPRELARRAAPGLPCHHQGGPACASSNIACDNKGPGLRLPGPLADHPGLGVAVGSRVSLLMLPLLAAGHLI